MENKAYQDLLTQREATVMFNKGVKCALYILKMKCEMGDVVEFVDLLVLLKIGDMIQWIGRFQILHYFHVRFFGSIIGGHKTQHYDYSPPNKLMKDIK